MNQALGNMRAVKQTLRELFSFYLLFITIFFLGRLGLFVLYYDRIVEAHVNHWYSFVLGLQMDTIVASIILVIPVLLLFTLPRLMAGFVQKFLRLYFLVFLLLVVYIENATFPFLAEFDVRPNDIFINYLDYPTEVLGNIWESYKPQLLLSTIMLGVVGYFYWKKTRKLFSQSFEAAWWFRLLWVVPVSALLFIGIRSSFGHRAANISTAVYTSSHLVNEIAKNSLFAIGYAYYSQKVHGGDADKYGKMDLDEAYTRVSRQLRIPVGDRKRPFYREVKSHFKTDKPKNLVIFLQESLGAQFVGALGNKESITPNIDRLSKESIFFDNLYSNGTRSIRGIAGSVAGFLPIPGKGVVKRNKSQSDFFTVASLLKPKGYHSSFIYGGMSNFDNMRSWFLGNGFEKIIEQPDYKDPAFVGVWGVSDEDLVIRANAEFVKYHKEQQPFVSVLFSSTNHMPFEYPAGRIEPIEGEPLNGVKNAIKFADYAIGKLIDDAKKEGYFEETVFMVISDHNVRTYGDDLVPVHMYHIMGMILGGGVKPQHISKLSTQPDVLATALDTIGLDLSYPILGKSFFEDPEKQMVLMQFHDMYALRNGNKVTVIRPDKGGLTFVYENKHLHSSDHNKSLERDAAAFVHVLNDMYQNHLYK